MSNVLGRNVVNSQYIFINSITVFYSRIILRKIDLQTKQCFRNLEKSFQKCTKINADLQFLIFCSNNQLLPRFTNFKLYDVFLEFTNETIEYKSKLLLSEIDKKKASLSERLKIASSLCLQLKQVCRRNLHFYSLIQLLMRLNEQFSLPKAQQETERTIRWVSVST